MGILRRVSDRYWTYFLAMERDLDVLSRYVDFATENMPALPYRIVLAKIEQAIGIGGEVQVGKSGKTVQKHSFVVLRKGLVLTPC